MRNICLHLNKLWSRKNIFTNFFESIAVPDASEIKINVSARRVTRRAEFHRLNMALSHLSFFFNYR